MWSLKHCDQDLKQVEILWCKINLNKLCNGDRFLKDVFVLNYEPAYVISQAWVCRSWKYSWSMKPVLLKAELTGEDLYYWQMEPPAVPSFIVAEMSEEIHNRTNCVTCGLGLRLDEYRNLFYSFNRQSLKLTENFCVPWLSTIGENKTTWLILGLIHDLQLKYNSKSGFI